MVEISVCENMNKEIILKPENCKEWKRMGLRKLRSLYCSVKLCSSGSEKKRNKASCTRQNRCCFWNRNMWQ